VVRHKVILGTTVSTMLIPCPEECEGFFRDSHNPSLSLLGNILGAIHRSQPRQKLLLGHWAVVFKDAHSFISACTIFAAVA
jgi:hypothetical protein